MIAAQKPVPLPGTRPEGARDEREAASRVRDMFTRIAPRYDFLNHLLSFSLDYVWRRRTAKKFLNILGRPDARVLDVCCGTGDLAFALDRARSAAIAPNAAGNRATIIGSDFVEAMLVRAKEKSAAGERETVFAASDVLNLPFADASFDLVTTAFGFRNLANYEEGLREFARVLKPGGELGILEFSEPTKGPMAGLFRFYFKNVLPRIGAAVSGNSEAYAYLPSSVSKFPSPSELSALMTKCGFADVRVASWNFGSVVLHSGTRQGELVTAVLHSDYSSMNQAIANGANLNEIVDRMTPLLWAILRGDIDAVRLLLERGADANARPNPNDSPLRSAEDDFGFKEIADLLRSHGATK
jgi:demethylmenaquinone methyltransferase / 2-methoxy-6-polyprenyl-1,4-benzoquinol methylase